MSTRPEARGQGRPGRRLSQGQDRRSSRLGRRQGRRSQGQAHRQQAELATSKPSPGRSPFRRSGLVVQCRFAVTDSRSNANRKEADISQSDIDPEDELLIEGARKPDGTESGPTQRSRPSGSRESKRSVSSASRTLARPNDSVPTFSVGTDGSIAFLGAVSVQGMTPVDEASGRGMRTGALPVPKQAHGATTRGTAYWTAPGRPTVTAAAQ